MRWDNKVYRERLRLRLKRLRAIRIWQFFVLLLLSLLVSAIFLRLNSLAMSELRREVIVVDQKGDNEALKIAIEALGTYVTTHMNTSLGEGFYLTGSYERAREAAVQAAVDTTNPDSVLYQQASVECQSASTRAPYGGYVPCVLARVQELGDSTVLTAELQLPRAELYKVNFVSPLWSPDGAGISVAISLLILLIIIARITGVIVQKMLVKSRFRAI